MLFNLGSVVATPGALALCEKSRVSPLLLIGRHINGDFGDLDDEDKQANRTAIAQGLRILSSYVLQDDQKVWLITEADRSATTLLLPEEY